MLYTTLVIYYTQLEIRNVLATTKSNVVVREHRSDNYVRREEQNQGKQKVSDHEKKCKSLLWGGVIIIPSDIICYCKDWSPYICDAELALLLE